MSRVFNDTSTKAGLIQECESQVFGEYSVITGSTDNLLPTFTRNINEALNRVTSLILQSDARWQFDDTNNTDLPIGLTTLTTDQQDYSLSVTHLTINRVEILDANGNWQKLEPIDQTDIYNQSLTDFLKTSGTPKYYDKIGNSLFLYPKPSYTQASSLKVYFQRPPSYFTVSDTTKTPGFNSIFHRLVALIASRDYAMSRSLACAKTLIELVTQGEQDLQDFYALRNKD